MLTIREYLNATSLEEAWKANQKRANRVLGGMGWMKMSQGNVGTAIDLGSLGLDKITETDEEFIIGAMVSLRQFELHEGLNAAFANAAKESVKHIVGVQFRNCATIGGSVWLRPAFSDPLTLLLALDCCVELFQGKEETTLVPLADFCKMRKDNSLLLAVHIAKNGRKVAYQSFRNTETDFPVLTCAVSCLDGLYRASVGARPALAEAVEASSLEELLDKVTGLSYGANLRAGAEYRCHLAAILTKRAFAEIERG